MKELDEKQHFSMKALFQFSIFSFTSGFGMESRKGDDEMMLADDENNMIFICMRTCYMRFSQNYLKHYFWFEIRKMNNFPSFIFHALFQTHFLLVWNQIKSDISMSTLQSKCIWGFVAIGIFFSTLIHFSAVSIWNISIINLGGLRVPTGNRNELDIASNYTYIYNLLKWMDFRSAMQFNLKMKLLTNDLVSYFNTIVSR